MRDTTPSVSELETMRWWVDQWANRVMRTITHPHPREDAILHHYNRSRTRLRRALHVPPPSSL